MCISNHAFVRICAWSKCTTVAASQVLSSWQHFPKRRTAVCRLLPFPCRSPACGLLFFSQHRPQPCIMLLASSCAPTQVVRSNGLPESFSAQKEALALDSRYAGHWAEVLVLRVQGLTSGTGCARAFKISFIGFLGGTRDDLRLHRRGPSAHCRQRL